VSINGALLHETALSAHANSYSEQCGSNFIEFGKDIEQSSVFNSELAH